MTAAQDALAAELKKEAVRLGFSMCGIAAPTATDHMPFYEAWVGHGRHGEMGYLAREDSLARRADLSTTLQDVRSVVVVAHEYFVPDPTGVPDDPSRAVIARYARGDDYHDIVKKKLLALLSWLKDFEPAVEGRAYVDTGPILERDLARRAGLGWFGRNTMLIHPTRGSYFFIGLLLLDAALPTDEPFEEDRCGTCRACLDACPTGALLGRNEAGAPVMDATRCISYLTIEHRGAIPLELRPLMGNRVYGCDICQEVCPWNERFAAPTGEPGYQPRAALDGPELVALAESLLDVDDQGFRDLFRKSPIKRAKRAGLLRNVCVALGNWGAPEARDVLERASADEEPLVREHATWGLSRLRSTSVPVP